MSELFRLDNPIKHYPWGCPHSIPELLGLKGDGSPWAELWMGAHSASPSRTMDGPGLDKLIAAEPVRYLGEKAAKQYGALPFLFKLLAAEKPLSIQAHPNLAQAREGFERENRAGIPLDAPNRSYKDQNHKPEIICALTPFTGLCGFRSPDTIRRLFAAFLDPAPAAMKEGLSPLLETLAPAGGAQPEALRHFLNELFGLSPAVCKMLTEYIHSANGESAEAKLMRNFAAQYPGDPAVTAPLYLNVFRLEPGEAVFLKAGTLHAYCDGFGVELMANSDNVLRGGLTGKHIDLPELMKVLDFNPSAPRIIKPPPDAPGGVSCFTYPASCENSSREEFSLSVIHGKGGAAPYPLTGPSIGIVTEGEMRIGDTVLKRGESVFMPPAPEKIPLSGSFTFYIASLP